MKTELLKAKILDLLIKGELTAKWRECHKDIESAEILLEKIRSEKEKLLNDELIAKGKKPTAKVEIKVVSENEETFKVPNTWIWCRLGDICNIVMGQSPDGRNVGENIDGMEFHQGKIFFTNKIISKSNKKTTEITKIAKPNSILFCMRAPVGKVNLTDRELCIGRGLSSILPYNNINNLYIYYLLKTLEKDFIRKATGTTFQAVTGDIVNNEPIPLPPLEEQKELARIAEKLLAMVDDVDVSYSNLEELSKKAKAKILDLLIKGELTSKWRDEHKDVEPADVLLEKIKSEKEKKLNDELIAKGKKPNVKVEIKEVSKNDEPFEIPKSWKWCHLGDILMPMETKKPQGSDFNYIDIEAIDNKHNLIASPKKLLVTEAPSRASRKLHNGDILFSMVRPYLKNTAFVTKEYEEAIASTGFYVLKPINVNNKFVFQFMLTPYVVNGLNKFATGDNSPSINTDDLKNFLLPLPPYVEQTELSRISELLLNQIDTLTNIDSIQIGDEENE